MYHSVLNSILYLFIWYFISLYWTAVREKQSCTVLYRTHITAQYGTRQLASWQAPPVKRSSQGDFPWLIQKGGPGAPFCRAASIDVSIWRVVWVHWSTGKCNLTREKLLSHILLSCYSPYLIDPFEKKAGVPKQTLLRKGRHLRKSRCLLLCSSFLRKCIVPCKDTKWDRTNNMITVNIWFLEPGKSCTLPRSALRARNWVPLYENTNKWPWPLDRFET